MEGLQCDMILICFDELDFFIILVYQLINPM